MLKQAYHLCQHVKKIPIYCKRVLFSEARILSCDSTSSMRSQKFATTLHKKNPASSLWRKLSKALVPQFPAFQISWLLEPSYVEQITKRKTHPQRSRLLNGQLSTLKIQDPIKSLRMSIAVQPWANQWSILCKHWTRSGKTLSTSRTSEQKRRVRQAVMIIQLRNSQNSVCSPIPKIHLESVDCLNLTVLTV